MDNDGMVRAGELEVGDTFYELSWGVVETYSVIRKTPMRVYLDRKSIRAHGSRDEPYLKDTEFVYTKASTLIKRGIANSKGSIRQWQSFIDREQSHITDLNRMLYKYQVEESKGSKAPTPRAADD